MRIRVRATQVELFREEGVGGDIYAIDVAPFFSFLKIKETI